MLVPNNFEGLVSWGPSVSLVHLSCSLINKKWLFSTYPLPISSFLFIVVLHIIMAKRVIKMGRESFFSLKIFVNVVRSCLLICHGYFLSRDKFVA